MLLKTELSMWLSNRTGHRANLRAFQLVFSVLCGLVLAGCSDLSVRQLGDNNQEVLRQIAVTPTAGREGQLYRRELQKLLYIGGQLPEKFELTSSISISASSALSVQGDSSTLKKMSMTTSFALRRLADGKTLLADSVTADATLGTVTSLYGQDKSEIHARERLAILLAQRVVRRLQLYFLEQSR